MAKPRLETASAVYLVHRDGDSHFLEGMAEALHMLQTEGDDTTGCFPVEKTVEK